MFEPRINTVEDLALSECANVLESTGLGAASKIGILAYLQELYAESA